MRTWGKFPLLVFAVVAATLTTCALLASLWDRSPVSWPEAYSVGEPVVIMFEHEVSICGVLHSHEGDWSCRGGAQSYRDVTWSDEFARYPSVVERKRAASITLSNTVPMGLREIRPSSYRRGVVPAHGHLAPGEIALTFDDGPRPQSLGPILDALDAYGVRATFFVVGWRADRHPDWVREIMARGHTMATHTYKHYYFVNLEFDEVKHQLVEGYNATMRAVGSEWHELVTPFFRFPGGILSARDEHVALMKHLGFAAFEWNMTTKDADSLRAGKQALRDGMEFGEPFTCDEDLYHHYMAEMVFETTMSYIRRNHRGILLLHDTKDSTAYALPWILEELANPSPNYLGPVAEELGIDSFTQVQFIYPDENRVRRMEMPAGTAAEYRPGM